MKAAHDDHEALPHQVRREDIYAGYRIPAGSTVFANTWYVESQLHLSKQGC